MCRCVYVCIQYLSTKSLGDNSGHSTRLYYFDTTTHPNKKIVVKNVVAEIKFCCSVVDKPIVFQFFAIRFALCPLPMDCCLNPLHTAMLTFSLSSHFAMEMHSENCLAFSIVSTKMEKRPREHSFSRRPVKF